MLYEGMTSWVGQRVRHPDGREGEIVGESAAPGVVAVTVALAGGERVIAHVTMASVDPSRPFWSWWCQNFYYGAQWLPLANA